jgi:hypothetical protein
MSTSLLYVEHTLNSSSGNSWDVAFEPPTNLCETECYMRVEQLSHTLIGTETLVNIGGTPTVTYSPASVTVNCSASQPRSFSRLEDANNNVINTAFNKAIYVFTTAPDLQNNLQVSPPLIQSTFCGQGPAVYIYLQSGPQTLTFSMDPYLFLVNQPSARVKMLISFTPAK